MFLAEFPRLRAVLLDPQFVALALVAGLLTGAFYFFGFELVPFLMALAFAYFLDHGVSWLQRRRVPRALAVTLVYLLYLAGYVGVLAGPVPFLLLRTLELARSFPDTSAELIDQFRRLPDLTLGLLTQEQQAELFGTALSQARRWMEDLAVNALAWLPRLTTWVVYLFMVPLLVFFFLKDKRRLLAELQRLLPRNRQLVDQIWTEMEAKMHNYAVGKVWEIVIVGVVTWLVFLLLGFKYPAVMGATAGISVLVPYVGAIAVAIPVAVLGYLQWGFGWDLGWLMIAYTSIQLVDGNILVPLIFSDAVQLHPALILLAVVVFGGVWGFWGVFFAIPLATLAKALLRTIQEFRERYPPSPGKPAA
jgi:putative permease